MRSLAEVDMPKIQHRVAAIALCLVLASFGFGQEKWPDLPYVLVPDWPMLPTGWNFGEVPGVAVDAEENVYVFTRSPHPLMQFTSSGKFLRSLLEGNVTSAHGVRIDGEGNIWVVDHNGHIVLKLNPAGRVVMVLGRRDQPATNETNFNRPTDVAVAPTGEIYVSDGYGNSRVMKFARDGKFVAQWGKKGSGPGEFNLPHSIVLDAGGQVYVADRENHRIQIFTPDGKFVKEWTGLGSPWGLAMTASGEIFMADGYANRVLKLAADGRVLGVLGSPGKMPGQFAFAHHLAVGRRGDIYVAEILNWRVQKFAPR